MDSPDVILLVNGHQFSCHRSILQQASCYFNAMFNSEMLEKVAKEIEIHDVEPEIFKLLIDFSYGKDIDIKSENVVSLLKSSSVFQFDSVQQKCCEYLIENIDITNCIFLWEIANLLNINSLYYNTKAFAVKEFSNIMKEKEFLHLSIKLLLELLSFDALNCENETEVFDSILYWTEHNQTNKMIDLLLCIRYQSLSCDAMQSIKNNSSIQINGQAKLFLHLITSIIYENQCVMFSDEDTAGILDEDLAQLKEKANLAAKNQPRKHFFQPLIVESCRVTFPERENSLKSDDKFLVLKINQTMYDLLVYTDDDFEELSLPSCMVKEHYTSQMHFYNRSSIHGYVVCTVGNYIYLFGGEYEIGSGHWNKIIWQYNLLKNKWTDVGRMESRRRSCLAIVFKETVYLIGGYGKYRKKLSSVESYNTGTGKWQTRSSLPNPVHSHSSAAVIHGEKIYLFSTPMYCYNPVLDEWKEVYPWVGINFSAAFIFKGEIYAVTMQDLAVLLKFKLPDFTYEKEFVFPSSICCGSLINNIFYGFGKSAVILYDMEEKTFTSKSMKANMYCEMCCIIPNYKNLLI